MLSVVKMMLKGEGGGRALNSHGNYIVDRGKSWKNHGIVVLNLCGNPVIIWASRSDTLTFVHANNKGAYQPALLCSLNCAFVNSLSRKYYNS